VNEFDELNLTRAIIDRNIVPMWTQFRLAVQDHVDSYNRLKEGRQCPARILEDRDEGTSMVIQQDLGMTRDDGHIQIVVLKIFFWRGSYQIKAEIERWLKIDGQPKRDGEAITVIFTLKGSRATTIGFAASADNVWFESDACEGEKLSAWQAARNIVVRTLCHGEQEPRI
jgi:hypothetical protein